MILPGVRADKYTFAVLVCRYEKGRDRHVAFPQIGNISPIGLGAALKRDFFI